MDGKLIGAADGKPTDLLKDLVQGIVEKALKSDKVKAVLKDLLDELLKPKADEVKTGKKAKAAKE